MKSHLLEIAGALSPWDGRNSITYAGLSASGLVSLLPSLGQLQYAVLAATLVWVVVQVVHRFMNWRK